MIDINHIAKLARLGLKEEEKNKLEAEFSAILGFIGKLKEADVGDTEPLAGGTDLNNIMRDDKIGGKNLAQRQRILDNAPKRKDGYVEVLAVFE